MIRAAITLKLCSYESTGAIVAAIGLVLAPIAIGMASGTGPTNAEGSAFSRWIALFTVVAVGAFAVYAPGMWRRLPILLGAIAGYLLYLVRANGMGLGPAIDFSKIAAAPLFGLPKFTAPVFDAKAMVLIAPVAIILVAENLGHLKGIAAMIMKALAMEVYWNAAGKRTMVAARLSAVA